VTPYINECRDLGLSVDPSDVNESEKAFTVSGGRIRFGLKAVENVGDSAIEEILRAREEGSSSSIMNFPQGKHPQGKQEGNRQPLLHLVYSKNPVITLYISL